MGLSPGGREFTLKILVWLLTTGIIAGLFTLSVPESNGEVMYTALGVVLAEFGRTFSGSKGGS